MAHPVPSGNRSFSKKASSSCKQIPAWQTQNNGEPKFKSASTTEREEDPIYTEATKCVPTKILSPEGQKTPAEPDQCPKPTTSTCLSAGRNQQQRRELGKTMPNEMKQPKLKQFKERRQMALPSHHSKEGDSKTHLSSKLERPVQRRTPPKSRPTEAPVVPDRPN